MSDHTMNSVRQRVNTSVNLPDVEEVRRSGKKGMIHIVYFRQLAATMRQVKAHAGLDSVVIPCMLASGQQAVMEAACKLVEDATDFLCIIVVTCQNEHERKQVQSLTDAPTIDLSLELPGGAPCPCESGRTYKTCCRKQGVRYYQDGTAVKRSAVTPHHQTAIPFLEVHEHYGHVPEEHRTDDNLKFNRFHFKNHDAALSFCKAVIDAGGFGTVVEPQSVRVTKYWTPLAESMYMDFETGPVTLGEMDTPYETPRAELRVDAVEIETQNPRTIH